MKPFCPTSPSFPRSSFNHQWAYPRDQYQICHTLQKAIFGSVHLAVDRNTGDHVVIKLSRKLEDRARTLCTESPELETEVYSKLAEEFREEPGSENVLKALDIRSDETQHWLILEYAEKGDCFELCKNGNLGLERAKAFFIQTVRGVQYLHRRGICHRDISLENILVTVNEICKIGDFGQARILGHDGPNGRAGKRGYMAPEIFTNQDVDMFSADVFSLGVCLFVMLSGCPPFAEATQHDQRFRVVQRGDLAKLVHVWNLSAKVPPMAIELLNGMLCSQDRRLTLDQVLAHPFLQTEVVEVVMTPCAED
jgi:serine/threonine protein kinase